MWTKANHRTKAGLAEELKADKTLEAASKTYGRLKLSGYGHSVPVQESLKEPRWSMYRKGRWEKLQNPLDPIGDLRPGAVANVPLGKRSTTLIVPAPSDDESSSGSSSHSQSRSVTSDSSPGSRQRVRHLARIIPPSDPEEVSDDADEGVLSATAPEFPALRIAPTASLTQAVTTSVFHTSQVETNGASASGASPVIYRTSKA